MAVIRKTSGGQNMCSTGPHGQEQGYLGGVQEGHSALMGTAHRALGNAQATLLPTGARTSVLGCALSYNGTKRLLQNWWALRASWDEKLQLFRACLWQSKAVCVPPNIWSRHHTGLRLLRRRLHTCSILHASSAYA